MLEESKIGSIIYCANITQHLPLSEVFIVI